MKTSFTPQSTLKDPCRCKVSSTFTAKHTLSCIQWCKVLRIFTGTQHTLDPAFQDRARCKVSSALYTLPFQDAFRVMCGVLWSLMAANTRQFVKCQVCFVCGSKHTFETGILVGVKCQKALATTLFIESATDS